MLQEESVMLMLQLLTMQLLSLFATVKELQKTMMNV